MKRGWAAKLALALAPGACGHIDFAHRGPSARDASPAPDALAPDAACVLGAWSAPVEHAELASAYGEAGAQLSADGLTVYFTLFADSMMANGDLYRATRPDVASPFGTPVMLAPPDTTANEDDPSPTGDELELYFTLGYGSTACIEVSRRGTTTDPWGTPVRLSALCTAAPAAGPYVTPDGLTLYYTVYGPTANALYVTARPDRSSDFTAGTPVAGFDSTDRGFPALSADLRTIYFETGMPQDIGQAERATPADPFGPPTALPFDMTATVEEDVSITADGRRLMFDSDRGPAGIKHIYEVTRACP